MNISRIWFCQKLSIWNIGENFKALLKIKIEKNLRSSNHLSSFKNTLHFVKSRKLLHVNEPLFLCITKKQENTANSTIAYAFLEPRIDVE